MFGSLIILIFGVFLIMLGVGVGIRYNTDPLPTVFMVFGIIICFCVIATSISNNKPSALDVYQGKTTLEITYRDSIPVDSIVVFKNNNNK